MSVRIIAISVTGLLLVCGCATTPREPTEFERKLAVAFEKEPGECIPRSWLMEEVSDSAIESDKRANPEVLRMVRNRQPGDKVFRYQSPPETWAALLGRGGFAVVREGKPILCVDTVIN